jgi:hypothetical protein
MNDMEVIADKKLAVQQYTHRRLSTAVISEGIPITSWTQISGNTYGAVVALLMFVNQLFTNNKFIVRTHVPTNFSDLDKESSDILVSNKVVNNTD